MKKMTDHLNANTFPGIYGYVALYNFLEKKQDKEQIILTKEPDTNLEFRYPIHRTAALEKTFSYTAFRIHNHQPKTASVVQWVRTSPIMRVVMSSSPD